MVVKLGKRFFDSILWPIWMTRGFVIWARGIPQFFREMTPFDKNNFATVSTGISCIGGFLFLMLLGVSLWFFVPVYFALAGLIYSLKVHNDYCKGRLPGQGNYRGDE